MSAVVLRGLLVQRAWHAVTFDGHAFVYLECLQPPVAAPLARGQRWPVVTIRRAYGQGPAAQIAAKCAANDLHRGQRVEVHAAGFAQDHVHDRMVLVGVDHVEPLDRPARYWQDGDACLENAT